MKFFDINPMSLIFRKLARHPAKVNLIAVLISILPATAIATPAADVLLKKATTWDGDRISYPAGEAELTAIKVTIEEEDETPLHCHPVPTFAYLMSGELEITTSGGHVKRLVQGEALVEVVNTWHKGKAIKGPVEIIVFYTGVSNVPTTIMAKSGDITNEKCTTHLL